MDIMHIEMLYNEQIKPLPTSERLRLLALIAHDLAQPREADTPEMMTITERLARANYQGGSLFRTADEVDAYIREERDAWER